MSPLAATTRWRAAPVSSVTTCAQKPAGSVRPPLSGSQGTAAAPPCAIAAPDPANTARTALTTSRTISTSEVELRADLEEPRLQNRVAKVAAGAGDNAPRRQPGHRPAKHLVHRQR